MIKDMSIIPDWLDEEEIDECFQSDGDVEDAEEAHPLDETPYF